MDRAPAALSHAFGRCRAPGRAGARDGDQRPARQESPSFRARGLEPFAPGTGDFPFSTINGTTGEASGEPITIKRGDRVRIRLYNASNLSHSMHLHGHDFEVVSQNGHPVAPGNRTKVTTINVAPGDFFEIEFDAKNPGNWIFHCHVPHHTSNAKMSGYNGAPVGMTRIFHYQGFTPVRAAYFGYDGPGG